MIAPLRVNILLYTLRMKYGVGVARGGGGAGRVNNVFSSSVIPLFCHSKFVSDSILRTN